MDEYIVFGFISLDIFVFTIVFVLGVIGAIVFFSLIEEVNRAADARGRSKFFWFLVAVIYTPLGALWGLQLLGDSKYAGMRRMGEGEVEGVGITVTEFEHHQDQDRGNS